MGESRRRRALTVRGSLVSQDGGSAGTVVIRLSDGHVVGTDWACPSGCDARIGHKVLNAPAMA